MATTEEDGGAVVSVPDVSAVSRLAALASPNAFMLFPVQITLPDGLGSLPWEVTPLEMAVELRQMLSDHPLTCCYTSYRLELEWPVAVSG